MPGNYAVGHNRYSTTGGITLRNIQPFFADTNAGGIGVAHNGNLTNAITLRKKLVEDGAIFYSTSDTETIVQLIAKSKRNKTIDKIVDALFQIQGGYALVMLTQNILIGVRDPFGIRPLVIGKLKDSYIFASETCALDIIGAKFVRDVENGEVVFIENNKLKSIKPFPFKKSKPCIFEYIYFARPDSILNGQCAYEYRKNFGKELAKETDINADLIVPVPDSGNAAAIGYSQHVSISFELGLIRNHYVGRTFIEPVQKIRSLGVKLKLNANKSSIKNKISYLTLYTFSTENWRRPESEINFLFDLIRKSLKKNLKKITKQGIKINVIGSSKGLPKDINKTIKFIKNKTFKNKTITLNLALNYGSKEEIFNAFKMILEKKTKDISIQDIERNLYTKNIPDPDIMIRTGGNKRLSNFLLWQLAYTEIFFIDKLWPDFNENDFNNIISKFKKIKRNFGNI